MSFEKPENLVISDETMAEYQAWLKKLKGGERSLSDEEITSLFSMTTCKLLANEECVNKLNCAQCPAAQETLIWARSKMKKDGILYAKEFFGSAYEEYPGLGSINMNEALNTNHSHIIHLQVEDGMYEKKGQQGMVTLHVS